jgi:hypothetical protein
MTMKKVFSTSSFLLVYSLAAQFLNCTAPQPRVFPIADAWAKNSINAVIFRRNSVITYRDTQFVSFYDPDGFVVLAKRKLDSREWEIKKTPYKGDVRDAHNSISIMVDGDGFLHLAWNHHNSPLSYCRSIRPGSLELTETLPMAGNNEQSVTYPEFYRMPDGNLLFFYRDGSSGRGNLVIDHYDTRTKKWMQRQSNLIDGEGQRSAYWQMAVDPNGTIHLSWVWRESWDVATNHDICYAKSADGGMTWSRSSGEKYFLPITAATAEVACQISQGHELINQTSMCADAQGHPYIATYWRSEETTVPQYFLVSHDDRQWRTTQISRRSTSFSLSGGGTKRIPISRPQILMKNESNAEKIYMIFRDAERGDRVSLACCDDLQKGVWLYRDLTTFSVGLWEPSFDTELWRRAKKLHIFVQKVGQGDAESIEDLPPQPASILEMKKI